MKNPFSEGVQSFPKRLRRIAVCGAGRGLTGRIFQCRKADFELESGQKILKYRYLASNGKNQP
jgi:hypothetical protein